MSARVRRWLPWLKLTLFVAIVVGVGGFFVKTLRSEDLQKTDLTRSPGQILWDETRAARPIDLVTSAILYVIGLGFSGAFWMLLLRRVREPLPILVGVRTYYISHLGKYAPLGKGWALLLRTMLANQGGVRVGTAALTGAYETLTTMAAGALLAAVVLLVQAHGDLRQMWLALMLLALAGIPILPAVFNLIVRKLAARFGAEHLSLPGPGTSTLVIGLALTACGWALLGGSLVAVLRALRPDHPWQASDWLYCVSAVAVSWVAGFVASTPGGLGPREFLLQQALQTRYQDVGASVVAVILLRVLWTVAELACCGVVYWIPATTVLAPSASAGGDPALALRASKDVAPHVNAEHRS
jgi:uncharacterized membrane protein YbhN (UPF0104 family)